MLQAGRSQVRNPMKLINFFNLLNPSGRIRPWRLLNLRQKIVIEAEKIFLGVECGLCVNLKHAQKRTTI
jgi:hypothetical protein